MIWSNILLYINEIWQYTCIFLCLNSQKSRFTRNVKYAFYLEVVIVCNETGSEFLKLFIDRVSVFNQLLIFFWTYWSQLLNSLMVLDVSYLLIVNELTILSLFPCKYLNLFFIFDSVRYIKKSFENFKSFTSHLLWKPNRWVIFRVWDIYQKLLIMRIRCG